MILPYISNRATDAISAAAVIACSRFRLLLHAGEKIHPDGMRNNLDAA
jgi:hypothetical protein